MTSSVPVVFSEQEIQEQQSFLEMEREIYIGHGNTRNDTHQLFDEIPQPSLMELSISESIRVDVVGVPKKEQDVGGFLTTRESLCYDAARVFDEKLQRKWDVSVFIIWGSSWIFYPGKTSFLAEDRSLCWNQELIRFWDTEQKIAMHILSSYLFQYLTDNEVIFVSLKHQWRWRYRRHLEHAQAQSSSHAQEALQKKKSSNGKVRDSL
jgi:hypothetical protein